MTITLDDFHRVDIRVGTVVAAEPFPEARKPAIKLVIDFGPEIGRKKSSAQITEHLPRPPRWSGGRWRRWSTCPPRQIGPMMSEVLCLGFPDGNGKVVLVGPSEPVPDGGRLF